MDSSFVSGTHRFMKKITKNAQVAMGFLTSCWNIPKMLTTRTSAHPRTFNTWTARTGPGFFRGRAVQFFINFLKSSIFFPSICQEKRGFQLLEPSTWICHACTAQDSKSPKNKIDLKYIRTSVNIIISVTQIYLRRCTANIIFRWFKKSYFFFFLQLNLIEEIWFRHLISL